MDSDREATLRVKYRDVFIKADEMEPWAWDKRGQACMSSSGDITFKACVPFRSRRNGRALRREARARECPVWRAEDAARPPFARDGFFHNLSDGTPVAHHQLGEVIEERSPIVGAGARLGVPLEAERRFGAVMQTLDRAVEK